MSEDQVAIPTNATKAIQMRKVKKIIGILLVKQCVLLDPKDAVPVRKIPLNRVPFVPNNEPLLGILDKFQDGRSHMAIVSRFSVQKAASVKQAVRRGLTQRLLDRVGMGESDSSSSDEEDSPEPEKRESHGRRKIRRTKTKSSSSSSENDATLRDESHGESEGDSAKKGTKASHRERRKARNKKNSRPSDLEMGVIEDKGTRAARGSFSLPKVSGLGRWEQSMPADAVLTKEGAEEFLQSVDPAIMPLGIITLEDVLEELIGEEIYDEFDPQGHPDLSSYAQTEANAGSVLKRRGSAPQLTAVDQDRAISTSIIEAAKPKAQSTTPVLKPTALPALKTLNFKGFTRSRSAPPTPRDEKEKALTEKVEGSITPVTVPEGVVLDQDITDILEKPSTLSALSVETVAPLTKTKSLFVTPDTHVPAPPPPPSPPLPPAVVIPATSVGPTIVGAKPKPVSNLQTSTHAPIPVIPTAPLLGLSLVPPSRGGSPAPSLEQAILIERKRRAAASTSQPVPKGARFKSSPLTGDRNGVVVAERVRRDMGITEGPSALTDDDDEPRKEKVRKE